MKRRGDLIIPLVLFLLGAFLVGRLMYMIAILWRPHNAAEVFSISSPPKPVDMSSSSYNYRAQVRFRSVQDMRDGETFCTPVFFTRNGIPFVFRSQAADSECLTDVLTRHGTQYAARLRQKTVDFVTTGYEEVPPQGIAVAIESREQH